ncbi:hypothetical protein SBBP2_320036 [Burkholderiales bacterium]|nr:hypothetical protein SBBP2_320036 [Burkholderiales bacterium]
MPIHAAQRDHPAMVEYRFTFADDQHGAFADRLACTRYLAKFAIGDVEQVTGGRVLGRDIAVNVDLSTARSRALQLAERALKWVAHPEHANFNGWRVGRRARSTGPFRESQEIEQEAGAQRCVRGTLRLGFLAGRQDDGDRQKECRYAMPAAFGNRFAARVHRRWETASGRLTKART